MGAFYGSIHIRTENHETVQKTLKQVSDETGCSFWLGPSLNGWSSVFPENSGQDSHISYALAEKLPDDIFHFIIHDDDVFYYFFYRNGQLIDQYNSSPDYFGTVSREEKLKCKGRPELFRDLLPDPKKLSALKALLAAPKENFVFESARMAQFVDLAGLTNALSSYEYLQGPEHDEIEGWDKFVHIEYSGKAKLPESDNIKRPDWAEACNKLGSFKRSKGDLVSALQYFNMAISLKPDFAAPYNNRGLVKKSTGNLNGALADFDKAIELKPDLAVAYNNRGEIKRAKQEWDSALADYTQAIELKPDLAAAYNNRAEIKRVKGDISGAMADFNKAIKLKPNSAKIHNNRGELKRAAGDLDGAILDYNCAIALDPKLSAAYNNRGEAKRTSRNFDEAIADYNKALELKPDLAATYNNRGVAKHAKGDLEGALLDLNKAIELDPNKATFFHNRAGLKQSNKNPDEALIDYNKAIELNPKSADTYNNRGETKRAQKDLEGALADYNRALELNPNLASAYNNRGLVKRSKDDLIGALADFNKAIELKPDSAQCYSNRGLVKQNSGDLDGALNDFNKALELKPDLATALKNRDAVIRAKSEPARKNTTIDPIFLDDILAVKNSLLLRTDYSDEITWKSLCATIQSPDADLTANVDFVSNPKYAGITADTLPFSLPANSDLTFAFIVDRYALSHAEHPILVIDLREKPGRSFRVVVSALWAVENNLSTSNMDFDEFANAVDKGGIFHGF